MLVLALGFKMSLAILCQFTTTYLAPCIHDTFTSVYPFTGRGTTNHHITSLRGNRSRPPKASVSTKLNWNTTYYHHKTHNNYTTILWFPMPWRSAL